jgi:hypothetical protein
MKKFGIIAYLMKYRNIIILLLVGTSLFGVQKVYAWNTINEYRWSPQKLPIKVTLDHVIATSVGSPPVQAIVTQEEWKREIRLAMQIWNGAGTALTFSESSTADAYVDIVMVPGTEMDGAPAATCFKSTINGICGIPSGQGGNFNYAVIKINKDVRWVIKDQGFIIYDNDPQTSVAHELGHVLGLAHSSDSIFEVNPTKRDALMYYMPAKVHRWLNDDDLAGLYHLYGQPITCLYCYDNAHLLGNSPQNGIVLGQNQTFNETFHLRNNGSTTWGYNYQLVFRHGDQLNAPAALSVQQTAPGQNLDINTSLVAPAIEGDHSGYWQLRNPQGTYFGPEIWVKITVQNGVAPATGNIDLVNTNYPTVVSPGQSFQPQVTVRVNQGELLESRGDLLRNTDSNLFGAWPHVAVTGTVNAGQTYTFTFYQDNPITAPSSEGSYDSHWQVWMDGNWAGPVIDIHFDVRNGGGTRPSPPALTSPGNWYVSNDGSTPQLCADAPSGLQYDFQIFQSHDIPKSGWISSNCWTPPGLGAYGYQWHAKVRNPSNGLESDWSETRNFNILSYSPTISDIRFNPSSPSASDFISYYACADTSYEMRVYTANDGTTNGDYVYFGGGATTCDPNNPNHWFSWFTLPFEDGTHAIRFLAFKNGQTRVYETSYTLQRRKPNGPAPLSPSEGIWLNSLNVPISWKPTSRTNSYDFKIATDDQFQNLLVNLPSQPTSFTAYNAIFSQPFQNLYWRIEAVNELGKWGNGGSFHLDIVKPSSQVAALPSTVYEPNIVVQ